MDCMSFVLCLLNFSLVLLFFLSFRLLIVHSPRAFSLRAGYETLTLLTLHHVLFPPYTFSCMRNANVPSDFS